MMEEKVDLRQRAAEQSEIAGYSLGKMLFRQHPGWSDETLFNFVGCLRPKAPMLITIYKGKVIKGFFDAKDAAIKIAGYSTGNKLPSIEEAIAEFRRIQNEPN